MSETTNDIQRDIALTRERMSETIAELDSRISHRVAVVKERLDLGELAREHPWPALAVALGLGILLSGTGADVKAARATARAAKLVPDATADLARRGFDAAASVVRRDGDGERDASMNTEATGLVDRLSRTITHATGVDELLGQMQTAAEELARPASYVGQRVPTNTGQRM